MIFVNINYTQFIKIVCFQIKIGGLNEKRCKKAKNNSKKIKNKYK